MSDAAALELTRPGDRCAMVIFGATGDLTRRKLIPALYNLAKKNLLPDDFALVGVAIDPLSVDEFRRRVEADLHEFSSAPDECHFCEWLLQRLYYLSGDFRDPALYAHLRETLAE